MADNLDYRGRRLRNQTFVSRSLAGADFSDSDIRGADFTDADLRGARFCRSRGGISPAWVAAVIAITLLLAAGTGVIAAMATSAMAGRLGSGETMDRAAVLTMTVIGFTMIVIAVFRDLRRAMLVGGIASAVVLAIVVPLLVIQDAFSARTTAISVIWVVAIVTTFLLGAVARASAGIVSPVAFFVVVAAGAFTTKTVGGTILAVLIALAAVILARRALADPAGAGWLHRVSRRLILDRATRYRRADLSNADFTDAVTGPSDFGDAIITGATFDGASVTGRGKVTPDRLLEAARSDEPD